MMSIAEAPTPPGFSKNGLDQTAVFQKFHTVAAPTALIIGFGLLVALAIALALPRGMFPLARRGRSLRWLRSARSHRSGLRARSARLRQWIRSHRWRRW